VKLYRRGPNVEVVLVPENPDFEPIELGPDEDVRVVAELVEVLPGVGK